MVVELHARFSGLNPNSSKIARIVGIPSGPHKPANIEDKGKDLTPNGGGPGEIRTNCLPAPVYSVLFERKEV